jgi:hypothetical protein
MFPARRMAAEKGLRTGQIADFARPRSEYPK